MDTWDFEGGTDVDPDELAYRTIKEAPAGTEGLSISGGEPMAQAGEVYALICSIKARRPDWSIGLFSGYSLHELTYGDDPSSRWESQASRQRRLIWDSITQHLAFAILGRYEKSRPPETIPAHIPWRHAVSSANQYLALWGSRYTYASFEPLSLEVSIDDGGLTTITGYVPKGVTA